MPSCGGWLLKFTTSTLCSYNWNRWRSWKKRTCGTWGIGTCAAHTAELELAGPLSRRYCSLTECSMAAEVLTRAAESLSKSKPGHFDLPKGASQLLKGAVPLVTNVDQPSKVKASPATFPDGRPALKGVTFDVAAEASEENPHRWIACVRWRGVEYRVGAFTTAAAAGLAWDAAARMLLGAGARTNFPPGATLRDAMMEYGLPKTMLDLPGYANEVGWEEQFPCTSTATPGSLLGSRGAVSVLTLLPPAAAEVPESQVSLAVRAEAEELLRGLGADIAPPSPPPTPASAPPALPPASPTMATSAAVIPASSAGLMTPTRPRRLLATPGSARSRHAQHTPERVPRTPPSGSKSGTRSGFRGVTYMARQEKCWQARIFHNGKFVYLGVYRSAEEAAAAYDKAARSLKGAAAKLNFPKAGESAARRFVADTLQGNPQGVPAAALPTQGEGGAEAGEEGGEGDGPLALAFHLPPRGWGVGQQPLKLGHLVTSALGTVDGRDSAGPATRGWTPDAWFVRPNSGQQATGGEAVNAERRGVKRPRSSDGLVVRLNLTNGGPAPLSATHAQPIKGTSVVAGPPAPTTVDPVARQAPVFVHVSGYHPHAIPGRAPFDPFAAARVGPTYKHAQPPPYSVYPADYTPRAGPGPAANKPASADSGGASSTYPGVRRGRPNSITGQPTWFVAVDRVGVSRWLGPFPTEEEAARAGDVARLLQQGAAAETHFSYDRGLFFAKELREVQGTVAALDTPADAMYAALGELKAALLAAAQGKHACPPLRSTAQAPEPSQQGQSVSVHTARGQRSIPVSSLLTPPPPTAAARLSTARASAAQPGEGASDSSLRLAPASSTEAPRSAATQRVLDAAAAVDALEAASATGDGDAEVLPGPASPTASHPSDLAAPGGARSAVAGGDWGDGVIKRV